MDRVLKQLDEVRRRREEAVRVEADLARRQAALEARLSELKGIAADGHAGSPDPDMNGLPQDYASIRSAAEMVEAIHVWRRNIRSFSSLAMDVRIGRDHVRGDPAAALVVVEYGDYQCLECAESHARYLAGGTALRDGGRLCVVFRHFPLVDAHPLALRAAQAAEAGAAQGRFWEMHDALMAQVLGGRAKQHAPAYGARRNGHNAPDGARQAAQLERAAARAGLDLDRFRADIDDPAILERILTDFRSGLASGVNGTPTFYVNGLRADGGAEELYAAIAGLAPAE